MIVWKIINCVEESILVVGMCVMVLFNFLNVVCRYLMPQTPFSYTEELVVLIFVWVSMFGISYGYRRGAHTMLTIFTDRIPAYCQPFIVVFSSLASVVLMVLLADTGYGMVMNQIKYGQILPGMQLPMAVVGSAIPFGAALTVLSIIRSGYLELKGASNG